MNSKVFDLLKKKNAPVVARSRQNERNRLPLSLQVQNTLSASIFYDFHVSFSSSENKKLKKGKKFLYVYSFRGTFKILKKMVATSGS